MTIHPTVDVSTEENGDELVITHRGAVPGDVSIDEIAHQFEAELKRRYCALPDRAISVPSGDAGNDRYLRKVRVSIQFVNAWGLEALTGFVGADFDLTADREPISTDARISELLRELLAQLDGRVKLGLPPLP